MKKKAQLTTVIFGTMLIFMVILVTALIAPFGAKFSSLLYFEGENLINDANETINGISNATIKSEIQQTLAKGQSATQDNISVTTSMFKWSWVIVLIFFAIIWLLFSRSRVQGQQGGFIG